MKAKVATLLFAAILFSDLTLGLEEDGVKRRSLDDASALSRELPTCVSAVVEEPQNKSDITEESTCQPVEQRRITRETTRSYPSQIPYTDRIPKFPLNTTECKYVRVTKARSKKTKIRGKTGSCDEEPAPCHPRGGVPKNSMPVPILHSDPNFEKVLTGELTERIVSVIVKKSSRSDKIRKTLGLCYFDLDQLGEELMNQPLETEGCCTKLKGELSCFLTWLLEQEPTRRRRDTSSGDGVCSNWQNCLSNASLALPSSFYGLVPPPLNALK